MLTVITELPEYIKRSALLLNESERKAVIDYLSEHPKAGDLMEGTGGIRKLRWRILMTSAYESIAQGLQEAIELNNGKKVAAKTHRPPYVDVAEIRRRLGLTQMEFAAKFCISVSTLRHWERGDRTPQGPALALLNVVAKEPQAVMRALG